MKGLFGGGSSSDDAEGVLATSIESSSSSSSSAASTLETPAPEKRLTLKDSNTIILEISTKFASVPPMTVPEKKVSREKFVTFLDKRIAPLTKDFCRLRAVDYDEAAKQRKEEARNSLEGYLYRVRDLLDEEGQQDTPFMKCSQASERKALAEKVSDSIAWLHDKGDLAETSQFWDKRNAVEYVNEFPLGWAD